MFGTKLMRHLLKNTSKCLNKPSFIQLPSTSQNVLVRNLNSFSREKSALLCGINGSTATFTRNYAKGKDKKKEKGKGKVQVNEQQIGELLNIETLKNQMSKSVDILKDEFVRHLSLRSTTGAFESLPVSIDGKQHTLQEIAQIVRKNPKTIIVNMATFPQHIKAVLKAIEKSGMNLNPQQEGTTLFIPIPQVTREHREGLAKNAKTLFIKCRDSVRDVQTKYVKQLKKKDGVSQDVARSVEQQIITIADGYIKQGESLLDSKLKELIGKD
ncbi:ribosome-recycling factor, mitochondrial [Aethina tumida]|uniref:ribosome-recycling factor, mitochondrial n=1 Tax=Aethina tumida TaxID=116153 RepID=UPI00096B5C23|nr:ribosome-recycling factor, mitochondrial [Aethina tumida]